MIGKTIAHYEILDLLGKGGMGEVYRARDTKLGREVALKVLPPETAENPERLARLQREAKVLAALNHPNIASIHGIEEAAGRIILEMELAAGDELGARIAARLPPEQTLELARQIAEGLEEAHAKGIVHRDLKPANIKVSPDGRVKILDFGLARAFDEEADPQVDSAFSPTITAMHTMAGTIIGTAAYMSPEQARGLTVDKRADIFAFGAILYEMLTGKQLFDGATVSDKLAAILKSEPDWSALPGDTPPRLRELLERCLAKKRRDRMQDVGDVRVELDKVLAGDIGFAGGGQAGRRGLPVVPALLGALFLAVLAGFWAWSLAPRGSDDAVSEPGPKHFSVDFPDDLMVRGYFVGPGEILVVSARPADPETPEDNVFRLYLKRPDRPDFETIPGSASVRNAASSPDGRWLAMIAPDRSALETLQLWKVPTDLGEPPLRIRTWPDNWDTRHIHWLPDGDLVALDGLNQLHRIPMDGSPAPDPIDLKVPPGGGLNFGPQPELESALPDGIHLLTTLETWDDEGYGQDIWAIDTATGATRLVLEDGGSPVWSDTGHLVFSRGNSILAVTFDPVTLETSGGMVAVADGLRTTAAWGHGAFVLSPAGDLYHKPGGLVGQRQTLAFTDRNFRDFTRWSDDTWAFDADPLVSPDGRYVATVFARPGGTYETWISRMDRPGFRLFASLPDGDVTPTAWTPDSREIVLQSYSSDTIAILIQPVDGGGESRTIYARPVENSFFTAVDFADAGRTLILLWFEGGRPSLRTLALDGAGKDEATMLLDDAQDGAVSPDGEWLAYVSTRGGRNVLQVRRWLGDGRLGPSIHVIPDEASAPRWYRAGPSESLEIWYFGESSLWSVPVTLGGEPVFGEPEHLAENRPELKGFDVLPDGRILERIAGPDEKEPDRLDVILGWKASIGEKLD